VSFMVEETLLASRSAPAPNPIGAVDVGLSSFIVDADGDRIPALRALHSRLRQLRRADRVLKRRRRGSGRYRAQQQRIARLHAKVADARANFLHQVSRRIVDENQVLVTETLNVRGMMRNRCLARAIADAGWGELRRQIAYKAQWAQRTHIEVDPWFPSTKRCSACHAVRRDLTLADFEGRVVLLNIWATWCPPCREEMPTLDALQARLGGSDFHVLPLSIDRAGLEPVRRFYRETGIRNLDLYIAEDTRAMLALAVVGLPTTILIDRIGRERGRLAGPAEWNSPEAVAQISALIDERKQ